MVSYCFSFFLSLCIVIDKVRDEMGSLCIICSLGQVKFSLDKNIMAINLSLGKYKFLLFPHPCMLRWPESLVSYSLNHIHTNKLLGSSSYIQSKTYNPPLRHNYFFFIENFLKIGKNDNQVKLTYRTPLCKFKTPVKKSWIRR